MKIIPAAILLVAFLCSFLFSAAGLDQQVPPAPGELVDIGGRKLHLWCSGKGSPTVIVESGASGFSIDWALVQPEVAKFTRICTYDRAGFAWSDQGPAINTVAQTMDDLHLLLRIAKVAPPYVLVGHSIGGLYVRAYQRRYPEEVAGLVLVDATPEDDARYLVKGVDKAGIDMSYDEMKLVYAPLIKNPPPMPQPWTEVPEPVDRLPVPLQRARVWAINKWLSEIDQSQWWITAESWKEEFIALRRLRLAQPYVLGNLPLVVLHRGKRSEPALDRKEAELAKMSRVGVERVAKESNHMIHLYQPELVVQAIRDVAGKAGHE
jgi:pimeloyl-ACP methyl ester carboxylesterase